MKRMVTVIKQRLNVNSDQMFNPQGAISLRIVVRGCGHKDMLLK